KERIAQRTATDNAIGGKSGKASKRGGNVDAALAQQAQSYREMAFTNDRTDQIKVYIYLNPRSGRSAVDPKSILPKSSKMTAVDMGYRSGVIEAWVNLDDV